MRWKRHRIFPRKKRKFAQSGKKGGEMRASGKRGVGRVDHACEEGKLLTQREGGNIPIFIF